jgi:hypothetical protein
MAIEPWEDIVAWADPGARWDPEPIVQSYQANTSYLDHLDAAFLASRRAPEHILYWPLRTGFDSRDPSMDPPATTETVYCHYVQEGLAGPWQILERVPDRCGVEKTVSRVHSHFGVRVDVPSAHGKMVVATFTLTFPLLSKLEVAVLKPPEVFLTTWTGRGRPERYRFVTGTAADDHVLSVPTELGYSSPFGPVPIRQFELSGGGWKAGQGAVTVVFRELALFPKRSACHTGLGGDGGRMGVGEQGQQLRNIKGIGGARAVRGDGKGNAHDLAGGPDQRGAGIPVRELSR